MKWEFSNNKITVFWDGLKCRQSMNCHNLLPHVFNPMQKPWINLFAAETNAIIEAVNQCPTGALTYKINNDSSDLNIQTDYKPKILVEKNGPYRFYGSFDNITLVKPDGTEYNINSGISLCRCGLSNNKPWCDNSHLNTEFEI